MDCFVICPIGSQGSDARERANKLMEHIIEPALDETDYSPMRADEISEPGSIPNQVIERTVESELVIADLTDHNPNVFYELAVRHATAKPYIQLVDSAGNIPFDIADLRTIEYNFDVEVASRAVENIRSQIVTIEENDVDFDTPISRAADFQSLRESDNPIEESLADILIGINTLNKKVDKIDTAVSSPLTLGSTLGSGVELQSDDLEIDPQGTIDSSKLEVDKENLPSALILDTSDPDEDE